MFGRCFNKIIFSLFLLCLLIPTLKVWAYSESSTHPGLAEATVSVYNQSFNKKIEETGKQRIIQGSIDEDKFPRFSEHFYDPAYNIGYWGLRSLIDWATNDSVVNDYSWNDAIKNYTEGKESDAYYALGHILHLLEDATVPDHTRGDSHASGSIFEVWLKNNITQADIVKTAKEYSINNAQNLTDLKSYLYFLTKYSNENYFSNGTIDNKFSAFKHEKPTLTYFDERYFYGDDGVLGERHILLGKFKDDKGNPDIGLIDYKNEDPSVFIDYFSRLGKQAVINGAMVINLFFQEGEKARAEYQAKLKADQARAELENKKLADRLSNQGTVGLIFSGFGFWISDAYTATKNISVSVGSAIADTGSFVGEIGLNVGSLVAIGGAQAVARSTEIATNYIVDTAKSLGSNLSASFAYVNNGLAAVFGVGQSTNFNTTNVNSLSVENEKTKLVEEDNGDMVIPTVVENNSTSGITTQQVQDFIKRFQEIYNQPKVENNTLSNVQKSYTGGMTFVPIYISNGTSAVVPAEVPPEATTSESSVILPAISLIDDPCAQSVATDGCLLVSTSTEISWQSTSTDTAYYSLNLNGVISTTTATSAPISLKDNQEYIFSVSSVTTVGTSSLPIQRKILHKDLPVIINEINWSGTIASIDDQWLELKNNTDYNISLNNFKVVNGSSTLEIPIHGAIKPNDYFVLEKKNASSTEPIKDLASYDWREWTGWLSMEGEDLYLIYSKDSLEKMIDYVPYCENWCNFGQPGESLERYDSEVGTNDLSSDWSGYSYYDYDVKNGLDRDDNDIYGTPGQRNGFSYLINKGQDISSEVVLKNDLVYFTQSDLNILENGSFAAGPGTVIKLRPRSNLNVLGKVYIRGEGDDLAVITSWEDGSLLNGINLYGGASGSIFNNLKLQNIKRGISGVDVKDLTFSNIEYSNGGGYQRILFNFDNSKVEISNLIGMSLSGELAHFENNSSVKFSNVVIKDETNALDSILSIYKNSEATVDYLEVKNNFCLFSCVSAYNNSKLSVSNSIFNNYSLDFGSAVDVYDYSQAVINNTKVLSGNQGIFTSDNGYSEIVDTEFSDIYYSAITSTRGGKVLGQRLNIHDNKIGAFSYYNLESTNTITDSLFVSNELAVLKGLRQGFTDDLNWLQDEQGPDELKYSMDLKNNWWGDLTGPKNERLNPDGKGDSVSDGVEFSPWYLDYNTKKLNTVLSNDKPEIEIFPDEEISTTTDDQIPETGNATTTDMLGSESDLLLQTASTTTDTI